VLSIVQLVTVTHVRGVPRGITVRVRAQTAVLTRVFDARLYNSASQCMPAPAVTAM